MQSSYTVKEFCENTKVARELAVVGQYEDAAVYYEGAISFMQRHLNACGDLTNNKQKHQVLHKVKLEYEVVKQAQEIGRFIGLRFDSPISTHRSDYEPESMTLKYDNDVWSTDDPNVWPPNLADKDKWPSPTTVDHW